MKEVKKLVLKKETITSLGGDEMNLLRGGASYTCGTGTSLGTNSLCTCVTCNNANTCFPTDYCPNPYGGGCSGGGAPTPTVHACGLSYDYCP